MISKRNTLLFLVLLLAIPFYSLAAEKETDTVPYGNNPNTGHVASVNGIEMYYETYGSGSPLLLIHGNGQSIAELHFQIGHFSRNYQVIVADSRAHGKSGLGTDQLTYMQMQEDYKVLLDQLELCDVNIVGWSDGGIVALLLAIHHPDKVAKMAVMGANLRPDQGAINDWVHPMLQPLSDTVDEMISNNDQSDDWHHHRQLLDLLMTQPDIPIERLRQIEAPVLVIAGDKDIIRGEHTLEIFDNLQNAHLAILPGQTHWAPATDPVTFNAMVETFFSTPFTRPESRDILEHELNPPDQ